MIAEGVNTLTVGVRTDTRTGLQKLHRVSNDKVTQTGADNGFIYATDYWQLSENSKYQEVTLTIEEGMKGQSFGFSLKKDGYIYINEPLLGVNNGDTYQSGNDYGLDDIY